MIYHDYAPIYHAAGQAAFGTALAHTILAHLPTPHRALDLACGTGAAALVFAAAGATVVGVDRSPAMLAIAREQASQRGLAITWIEADIRALPDDPQLTPHSFDLCTCLFDSLNHLTGDDDLTNVCRAVGRLLRPGGHFIFDLNTLAGFRTWHEYDQVIFDGRDLLVVNRLHFDQQQQRAYGRFVWFQRRGERWWRGEETHCERPWSDDEIAAALAAGELLTVARLTPEWTPAASDAPRVVYVAERRGAA
ncbi:class I SAM-dependent methyltransferase [Chloroflexus sp.]|uniref:class I SAM-dependent DNA methyltransferase n=1 Tax=Chloroflexus sp. TaxID=1904827 RepID=UPI00298F130D|nr:class I SAM-dependent methyltransferase [Chloroflexus sp.]MDW8404118.1 class I SAM-dependent methyltransferase [Chloroflexus sp.]